MSFCNIQPIISRQTLSRILFMDHMNFGILLCKLIAQATTVVFRSIIYKNDLNILQCLSPQGIHAAFYIALHIVNRYNYAYKRLRNSRFHHFFTTHFPLLLDPFLSTNPSSRKSFISF